MTREREPLDYAKPAPASGIAHGFRLIGAAVCVFTTLAGLGILAFGATAFLELPEAPTRDRPHYVFVGSLVSLVGLLIAGASVRWFVNAVRRKQPLAIGSVAASE